MLACCKKASALGRKEAEGMVHYKILSGYAFQFSHLVLVTGQGSSMLQYVEYILAIVDSE